jgi:hypothetical protein
LGLKNFILLNIEKIFEMKKIVVFVFILLSMVDAISQEAVFVSGHLLTDQRLGLKDENPWLWNENRLSLQFNKRSSNVRFQSEIWVRNLGVPDYRNLTDLSDKNKVQNINLDLRELSVSIRGFLFEPLDLKIGKQRIAWGTADQFNPTDNLNPYDLEDILDFGRHNGSEAFNAIWNFTAATSFQMVYIPFFRPANLPLAPFAALLTGPDPTLEEWEIAGIKNIALAPGFNFRQGAVLGTRFRSSILNTDFSLSYVYGRDGFPLPQTTTIRVLENMYSTEMLNELAFQRYHIFGADMAGSIGPVGAWAEAALFLPEEEFKQTTYFIYDPRLEPNVYDTILIEKKPFLKFVIGADYTFRDGSYVNIQFLHGFVHERGKGQLNNYLLFGWEKSFFSEKWLVRPVAGGIASTDNRDFSNNYGIIYSPEISYKGIDNLELGIGAYIFEGKGGNLFNGLKDFSMVTGKVKYSF